MLIRLDKFLADQGLGTRTEVKGLVKKGRVKLDGLLCKSSDMKFDPEKTSVTVDDVVVGYQKDSYYMMNKPQGVICANEDKTHNTVIDLMDVPGIKDLFCVGRLDIDTEGLLLITNDGELSHRLLSPKKHVEKTYYVELDSDLTKDAERIIEEGFYVDEELTAAPGKLVRDTDRKVYLTITEGKFHQVKRMMHKLGSEVVFLKRVSFGGLKLDESLALGEYRSLTAEELELLKNR